MATREEANYILNDDGNLIRTILEFRPGIVVVYEGISGSNEVIFGVGDDYDMYSKLCEKIVVHLGKLISSIS